MPPTDDWYINENELEKLNSLISKLAAEEESSEACLHAKKLNECFRKRLTPKKLPEQECRYDCDYYGKNHSKNYGNRNTFLPANARNFSDAQHVLKSAQHKITNRPSMNMMVKLAKCKDQRDAFCNYLPKQVKSEQQIIDPEFEECINFLQSLNRKKTNKAGSLLPQSQLHGSSARSNSVVELYANSSKCSSKIQQPAANSSDMLLKSICQQLNELKLRNNLAERKKKQRQFDNYDNYSLESDMSEDYLQHAKSMLRRKRSKKYSNYKTAASGSKDSMLKYRLSSGQNKFLKNYSTESLESLLKEYKNRKAKANKRKKKSTISNESLISSDSDSSYNDKRKLKQTKRTKSKRKVEYFDILLALSDLCRSSAATTKSKQKYKALQNKQSTTSSDSMQSVYGRQQLKHKSRAKKRLTHKHCKRYNRRDSISSNSTITSSVASSCCDDAHFDDNYSCDDDDCDDLIFTSSESSCVYGSDSEIENDRITKSAKAKYKKHKNINEKRKRHTSVAGKKYKYKKTNSSAFSEDEESTNSKSSKNDGRLEGFTKARKPKKHRHTKSANSVSDSDSNSSVIEDAYAQQRKKKRPDAVAKQRKYETSVRNSSASCSEDEQIVKRKKSKRQAR